MSCKFKIINCAWLSSRFNHCQSCKEGSEYRSLITPGDLRRYKFDYYSDGSVKSKRHITKKGAKYKQTEYYKTGIFKAIKWFRAGKQIGEERQFYSNGTLKSISKENKYKSKSYKYFKGYDLKGIMRKQIYYYKNPNHKVVRLFNEAGKLIKRRIVK